MIDGIGSTNSTMPMMHSGPMERHQSPRGKDVFQMTDKDRDGLVSGSELETLAKSIEEVTGTAIDIDAALSNFDADEDGALSGEELKGFMESNGFAPPGMFQDDKGDAMRMLPPPPPSSEKALAAYDENSEEDQISQLLALLKEQNGDDWEVSSIDVSG
jgi:Ca2+-binding EF-hand superfamily protein